LKLRSGQGIVPAAYDLLSEQLLIQLQVSTVEKALFAMPSLTRQEEKSKIE